MAGQSIRWDDILKDGEYIPESEDPFIVPTEVQFKKEIKLAKFKPDGGSLADAFFEHFFPSVKGEPMFLCLLFLPK